MEHAPNQSLLDYVRARKRLAEGKAALILKQIVAGLQYCHSREVVHRAGLSTPTAGSLRFACDRVRPLQGRCVAAGRGTAAAGGLYTGEGGDRLVHLLGTLGANLKPVVHMKLVLILLFLLHGRGMDVLLRIVCIFLRVTILAVSKHVYADYGGQQFINSLLAPRIFTSSWL
eukprot:scaffold39895_cov20-Tisochrysis_lutea.AAC.3